MDLEYQLIQWKKIAQRHRNERQELKKIYSNELDRLYKQIDYNRSLYWSRFDDYLLKDKEEMNDTIQNINQNLYFIYTICRNNEIAIFNEYYRQYLILRYIHTTELMNLKQHQEKILYPNDNIIRIKHRLEIMKNDNLRNIIIHNRGTVVESIFNCFVDNYSSINKQISG